MVTHLSWGHSPILTLDRKALWGTKWVKEGYCDKPDQFGQSLLSPPNLQVLLPSLPDLKPPFPVTLLTPATVPSHLVGGEKDGT